MKLSRMVVLVVGLLALLATAAHADSIIIDDVYRTSQGVNAARFGPIGQSFTAVAQDIFWIAMFPNFCGCEPPEVHLDVLDGAGFTGSLVASRTTVPPRGHDGFLYFDFSGTQLQIGHTYTAVISVSGSDDWIISGSTYDVYDGGMAFLAGEPVPYEDWFIRVLDTEEIPRRGVAVVPEPASVLLLATGLCLTRRRTKRSLA